MNQNNYYNWLQQQGVVGGIFYQPVRNTEQVDIYGNSIDFNDLVPSFHSLIRTGSKVESEYQPKYESVFKRPMPEMDSEQVVETNNATVPAASIIIPSTTSVATPKATVTTAIESVVPEMRITTRLKGRSGFKQLEKLYEQELEKRGIDKAYAKWLASKDALETGWGEVGHGAAHLNYGNITVGPNWTGKSYEGGDHDAKGRKIKQRFRSYDSINDYIEDQLNLLTRTSRYKDLFIGDVSSFADRLYKAGYAEDPRYANKIKQVYNSW